MKFDTPADHQSDRPAEGRRQADRPHRRPAQDHRHRALRLRAPRRRAERRPTATSSAPASPRAASPRSTSARRQGRAGRARHRHRRERRQARQGQVQHRASCSAGPRSSTTTRPSRSSWPRPSSRRAPRRSWCASTTRAAEGAFDLAAAKDGATKPKTSDRRPPRHRGRRLRRRLRRGAGAARRHLHHARPERTR